MYRIRFIQYVAPEYGDGENSYYIGKDFELPMRPNEKIGFQISELGPYVWFPRSGHYNVDENRYYMTLHSHWFQVWDGNEYKSDETLAEMEAFLDHLRSCGWDVIEKPETYY